MAVILFRSLFLSSRVLLLDLILVFLQSLKFPSYSSSIYLSENDQILDTLEKRRWEYPVGHRDPLLLVGTENFRDLTIVTKSLTSLFRADVQARHHYELC